MIVISDAVRPTSNEIFEPSMINESTDTPSVVVPSGYSSEGGAWRGASPVNDTSVEAGFAKNTANSAIPMKKIKMARPTMPIVFLR